MKATTEDEAPLDHDQHKAVQAACWQDTMASTHTTRHQLWSKRTSKITTVTTQLDNKKLKRMIRYVKRTRCMRHNLRPKMQTQDKRIPLKIDTHTDANWASRETTRKSTTGFVLYFFGAAVHYGSRAQATIALSSAESELYAIGTAAQESLSSSGKHLKYAPTSGYTQTAAQQSQQQ